MTEAEGKREAHRRYRQRNRARLAEERKSLGWCDRRDHHNRPGGRFVKPPALHP